MTVGVSKTDYQATQARLSVVSDGDSWHGHIRSALSRSLPEFQPALVPHDGTIVVCGSGPSLPALLEQVKEERAKRRPIIAIKGAHDLLCEAGIEPDMFVSIEPRERISQVSRKNSKTLYLLASRCSPAMFDHLSDCKVMLFHTYADVEKPPPELHNRQLVGGGSTSGLRAVTLGWLLGFQKFVLFGFDSCIAPDGRKRFDSGTMRPEQLTDRWVNGRRFFCNGAMALQADEFQLFYSTMAGESKIFNGISFDVRGNGLIAAIVAERRRLGKAA